MSIHEHVKFWHDPLLNNLELLHATYITHSFAPHTHEGYVFAVIERGAEQFKYQRKTHIAPAGSIVIINPGEMHTGSSASEQGWTYRTFYPSTELMQSAVSDLVGRQHAIPFFASPVIYDPVAAAQLSSLHHLFEGQTTLLERESHLLWTLAQLLLRYADDHPRVRPPTKAHTAIQLVHAYLDEHYTEAVSLELLGTLAQLSPFHLLRAFRDQVGLPPHAYQLQLRINHARRLLRAGVSCVETALLVGFADQSHFTKQFKRIVGVPPGQYRLNS